MNDFISALLKSMPICLPIVDDALWRVADPTTCFIANSVLTWVRSSDDSFVEIPKTESMLPGSKWALRYEVTNESGIGGDSGGIYVSSVSSLRPESNQLPTMPGVNVALLTAQDKTQGIRFTPTKDFSGKVLQIKNFIILDLGFASDIQ